MTAEKHKFVYRLLVVTSQVQWNLQVSASKLKIWGDFSLTRISSGNSDYGKMTLRQLRNIVADKSVTSKWAFFDLDGTIHRGGMARFTGNYANADLLAKLFSLQFDNKKAFKRIIKPYFRLLVLYSLGGIRYKLGQISRTEFEKTLIDSLHFQICPVVSERKIGQAAEKVVRYAFPHSLAFIRLLAENGFRICVISKAHEKILEAYQDILKNEFQTEIDFLANPRLNPISNKKALPLLSGRDKYRLVRERFQDLPPSSVCLVFGDTAEDICVFKAVNELTGKVGKTYLVSVGSGSPPLMKASDFILNDYQSIKHWL